MTAFTGIRLRWLAVAAVGTVFLASCSGGNGGNPPGKVTISDAQAFLERAVTGLAPPAIGEPWFAFATARPLKATEQVKPADGTSSFKPTGDYWFAFVDLMPAAAFEHPVKFVFADAATGKTTVEDQTWWPVLGDVGLIVADVPHVKLHASEAAPADAPPRPTATGDATIGGGARVLWAIYPNYAANTADLRLFVDVPSGAAGYLNVVADVDQDGKWNQGEGGGAVGSEWLVRNFALPANATGPVSSDAVPFPLDANKKFTDRFWARVSISASPIDEGTGSAGAWVGACEGTCDDVYVDLGAWPGPACAPENMTEDGCKPGVVGPMEPLLTQAVAAEFEGAPCNAFCAPDDVKIDTRCKALVINFGDAPGQRWMWRETAKAGGFFNLRLGDGATRFGDRPTAAQAASLITRFMDSVSCLDEAHLYLIGHGYANGGIQASNGGGRFTPAQLHTAITSASHCPATMDYYTDGCRAKGYCNLNVSIMSCYAGNFVAPSRAGANSIDLPGINVLTAASESLVSYGSWFSSTSAEDEEGFRVGHAFRGAFTDDRADAPPNGDGDGVVTSGEAMRWAQAHYDRGVQKPDGKFEYASNPGVIENADCNCRCEKKDPPPDSGCAATDPNFARAVAIATFFQLATLPGCSPVTILEILHSMASIAKRSVAHDHTTILAFLAIAQLLSPALVVQLFNNTDFPCGNGANGYTLCPTPPGTFPDGDSLVFFNVLEKPVPLADPANRYQYGFVFDADGDTQNNYKASAQYPNDFFKDTDRWYEANYQPGAGWTLKVTDATGGTFKAAATKARLIIKDNVIALVVPASEFKVAKPKFRLTAFRHTGDYGTKPPYNWDGSLWPAVADGLQAIP